MQHTTGSFTGLKDIAIFTQHWLPDAAPRAVIVLVHGYAEHSSRYAHIAAYLTAREYAVYALDHRGHGRSEGARTQVRDFDEYVTDLRTYVEQVRAAHPDLPLFLYGHSMGSLISLLYTTRWQDDLAGVITTGTLLKVAGVNDFLTGLLNVLRRVGPGLRAIPALPADSISHDPAVVETYAADPLVFRGRFRLDMAAAMARAAQRATAVLPDLRLPYLALHGGEDPLALPRGAAIVRERSGAQDTTVKVYEGLRHEIHNEPQQDEVLGDIAAWLDARVTEA
ncbi:MAG: lysophospholipase [Anaerolineae bacterium]|nr:lysophospholipase [Anaerolineae bacterium]